MPEPPASFAWWAFDPARLVERKDEQGLTISVCLPARDEAATVGDIVAPIRRRLVDQLGLVDELIVVDDCSTDATAATAMAAGADVVPIDCLLPDESPGNGKGNVIWRSLAACTGDLVCWVDADIRNFELHFITGLLGPLLGDPEVSFVKGHYRRPLDGQPTGGGRVSELVARPLLSRFFPELAGFAQPLAGEYAGRRALLESIPIVEGWGVEIGLLVDAWRRVGMRGLAQVDLGVREHRNRPLDELAEPALAVLTTVLTRAAVGPIETNPSLLRFAGEAGVVGVTVPFVERPPVQTVSGYHPEAPRPTAPRPVAMPPAAGPSSDVPAVGTPATATPVAAAPPAPGGRATAAGPPAPEGRATAAAPPAPGARATAAGPPAPGASATAAGPPAPGASATAAPPAPRATATAAPPAPPASPSLLLPDPEPVDRGRIAAAVRELLLAIGEDPDRDGLLRTPQRVAEMYAELCAGMADDPARHLDVRFEADHDELVLVRDISFSSLCEHHLMPFIGRAHLGYIPGVDGCITGLSKLARLVEGFARRPQVQERLTSHVADALVSRLQPRGVIVVVEAEHLCMTMRGVRKPGAITVTSAVRGLMRDDASARAEAMSIIHGPLTR